MTDSYSTKDRKSKNILILLGILLAIFVFTPLYDVSLADVIEYIQLYSNATLTRLNVTDELCLNESCILGWFEINITNIQSYNRTLTGAGPYLYNDSEFMYFNEAFLNNTISDIANYTNTDTNESTRFNTLTDTNCVGTDKMVGVDVTGLVECDSDINWDTNASTACALGEYLDGNGYCYDVNNSIDERTASVTYLPIVNVTVYGTAEGDISDINGFNDMNYMNISEAVGSPGLAHYINFTDVADFNQGITRVWYEGGAGDIISIGVWNYNTLTWDEDWAQVENSVDFVTITGTVFGAENYIGTGIDEGVVQVRFYHDDSGNPTHVFHIDYIALVDGFSSFVTTEHDALSGRDSILNHEWAMPITLERNATGNLTYSIESGAEYYGDTSNNMTWNASCRRLEVPAVSIFIGVC